MQAGDRLGRYEIKDKIGSGGMGEVYRAVDEQLDRNVALKVLLPEFLFDSERVKRFKFEAKAVSALNHPGIITIHEIVEENERLFIATELVNGYTLRRRIERGDLSVYESVKIAEQVADALAVAHGANIVHRDIKPENIMVRSDGYVKVLDFGLAKPIVQAMAGAEDATIQMVKTQPGLVMGSVRYMSPEQARGKETDGTTDVWSLGIVLYEMLSGTNPFDGETISDSIAALIHKDPEPLIELPDELRRIIRKCLNKKSGERYQNIKDLALDLKEVRMTLDQHTSGEILEHSGGTASVAQHNTSESKTLIHKTLSTEHLTDSEIAGIRSTRENTISARIGRGLLPAVAAVLVLLTGFSVWFFAPKLFRGGSEPFKSLQVSRLTDNGRSQSATVSPDGRLVAYVDTQDEDPRLVVQQIASGTVVEIVPHTKKNFKQPVFSSDGNFIYYLTIDDGLGTLFKVPSLGGKSVELVTDVDFGPAVTSDGSRIAFIRHNPTTGGDTVYMVDGEGKDLTPFANTKEMGFDRLLGLTWTAGDEKLLLVGDKPGESPNEMTSLIAVDGKSGKTVDLPEVELINSQGWSYVSSFNPVGDGAGYLFIGKREDDDTRQIWNLQIGSGTIDSVTTDTSDYESLSVSADAGVIIATKADRISGLVELDREGKMVRQIKAESKNFLGHVGIAEFPDGRIVYPKLSGKNADLYVLDKEGESERQLTSDSGINWLPTITPDGKYIVFCSSRNESFGLWRMNADGSDPKLLTRIADGKDIMPQVSGDGRTVFFVRQMNNGGKGRLMKISIDGGEPTDLFPGGKSDGMMPQLSYDGKHLAFVEFVYDESRAEFQSHIEFAEVEGDKATLTGKKIAKELGSVVRWKPDGSGLTFVSREGPDNIFEVEPVGGKPEQLTKFTGGMLMNFIWARDGQSIYAVRGNINSDLVLIRNITGA